MSIINESNDLKEELIAKIKEEKISSKITETDNHNVSKNIAVCQKSLQKQSLEKLIERSSNKQKLVRCMAIVSKEIHHIMLNIELKKEKQPSCFPTQPIRTYTQKYQQLSDDMANLIFDRSMISIEQREQDLNKRQRMVSFKVNDVSNKNSATEVTIKTGNWNNESNILTLLLQQARKQTNSIDIKDNSRRIHIKDLQKRIDTLKETVNTREKENAKFQADLKNCDENEMDFSISRQFGSTKKI